MSNVVAFPPPPLTDAQIQAERALLKKRLKNRNWRLDNLYWIKDEDGNEIPFRRNDAQRAYSERIWTRDVIAKARRLGFSTFIGILILDTCVFRSNTLAAIIDDGLASAKKKLNTIRFAYEKLPEHIRLACPTLRDNSEQMEWANGSSVSVGTSYRGGGLSILHVSEFGKISIDTPDVAVEIKTGSMPSVPLGGFIAVESTAHGTAGEFYDMVERAKAMEKSGQPLTSLDYRLHFYGWWVKKENRLPNNLIVLTAPERAYFAEIAPRLLSRHGVTLDADQQSWYAVQLRNYGPDKAKEEFPALIEEIFFNSIEGAFWKAEIAKMRADQRIGMPVPFDPSRRVNTAWDIGLDCTAIIFHQTDGLRHRIIDYWEDVGASLQAACGVVAEKRELRKFVYQTHFGPHDLAHGDWANSGKTRKEIAASLGVEFTVVPVVAAKADSIEAARRFLGNTWIDSVHASKAADRFENYRKRWNKAMGVFTSEPLHDMASHGSDAMQQLAMGLEPDNPVRDKVNRERPKRSQWSA